MTYGFTIHYDIEIDFVIKNEAGEYVNSSMTLEKIYFRNHANYVTFKYVSFK